MADVSQVERQLYILAMLSDNKRGFTINNIVSSLGRVGIHVSRKTVERDIDYISKNFFVYEEERDGRTVYFANKYSVENINFTISELIALHFAREILRSYSSIDTGASALKILNRIIGKMPEINRAYIDELSEMVKVSVSEINPKKDINREFLDIIREAIESKNRLVIDYHSFNRDETTTRMFDPYLLEISEGCWHLVGHCHLRKAARELRVSRIRGLKTTGESFDIPENFYENYKKDRFFKLAGDEKVKLRLRFTGSAARFISEYEYERADFIEEDGKGGLIFERTTTMTPEILKWVLGFGSGVEALEPEKLKEQVVQQAQLTLNKYCAGK